MPSIASVLQRSNHEKRRKNSRNNLLEKLLENKSSVERCCAIRLRGLGSTLFLVNYRFDHFEVHWRVTDSRDFGRD
ncbi:MAG: hypothetical protein ACTHJ3_05270, partial [Pararhizobium sp.]